MKYGELIRELLGDSGETQEKFAEEVGVTPEHLSTIMNGKNPGSLKLLVFCLKYVNRDIQEFLYVPDSDAAKRHSAVLKKAADLLDLKNSDIAEGLKSQIEVWHSRYVRGKKGRPRDKIAVEAK